MFQHSRLFLFFIGVFMIPDTQAENDSTRKKIRSDVFISLGSITGKMLQNNTENFRKLAPASSLLNKDFTSYGNSERSISGNNVQFMMGLGLRKANGKGPLFRMALCIGSGTLMNQNYQKQSSYRIDTLISQRTGEQVFVDSTVYENYQFRHRSQLLQLDFSALWRSKNPNKLKLFAGIGMAAGFSLNASSNLSYNSYSNHSIHTRPVYAIDPGSTTTENFTHSMQSTAALYFPFGCDYQLSRKHKFWKPLHLFFEMRMRLQYYKIPEIDEKLQGNFQWALGIRFGT